MSETNHDQTNSSSPYVYGGWLIQEQLPTQWHLLVAAILLNQSKRSPAWDLSLSELFSRWPSPSALASADGSLEELLTPQGFGNVKAKRLRRMSEDYQSWDGQDPRVLYGCGQYAYDSWRIFVRGDRPAPEEVNDGVLVKFLERCREGWRIGLPLPQVVGDSVGAWSAERVRDPLPPLQTEMLVEKRVYSRRGNRAEPTGLALSARSLKPLRE
jgi:hypothetical protein